MSGTTLETVLYELGNRGKARAKFKEDADAFLSKYPLSDREKEMVREFDVKSIYECGVNPMLTMGFWLSFRGPQTLPKYIQAMAGK